jgi:hypothetical protein
MWILNEMTIKTPRSMTIGDIQYPSSIFTRWSKAELAVLGIKPYRLTRVNERYYWTGNVTNVETDGEVVGTPEAIARDVDRLKEGMLQQINSQVSSKQGDIDWYWSRASKGGKAIPAEIEAYATAIYADQVTKEAEVNALTTLEDVMAYEAVPHLSVRKVKHTSEEGVETYGPETEEFNVEINMVTGGWTENPNDEVDPSFVSLTKV